MIGRRLTGPFRAPVAYELQPVSALGATRRPDDAATGIDNAWGLSDAARP